MKEKKSEILVIRITESTKKFLEETSKEHDRSVSNVVDLFIKHFKDNPPKQLPIPRKK